MIYTITIPSRIDQLVRSHLFQNELEQGAFLYAVITANDKETEFNVVEAYLVPPEGWQIQMDVHLEMKDGERAKIMNQAKQKNLALVDCHSHPAAFSNVWFSPSDRYGISEFAAYAKWKLSGKPYAAMVWAESSIDAVAWDNDFTEALPIQKIVIEDGKEKILVPKGSWFASNTAWRLANTNA